MKLENQRLCVELSEMGAEATESMTRKQARKFCGKQILHIGNGTPRFFFQM